MANQVRLGEVLTAELIERHRDHIRDFLALEGIAADQRDLAAATLSERQIKELLEELAEGS
jgi:hypothetical protein